MAEAKFYTYVHRRADTGEIFYVGKGVGKRAFLKTGRSEYWHRVVEKHGYTVHIVLSSASEGDSFRHEVALIALLRATGLPLVNLTNGGEGASGRVHGEETKARMSAAASGRKMSAEAIAKMRAAKIGKKADPQAIEKTAASNRGRKRSRDAVERSAAGIRGRKLTDQHRESLRKAWEVRRLTPFSDRTIEKMRAGQCKRRNTESRPA